ncbi:MAG TPA: TonB-dependent receptor [Steroidobacteraceae bacterium]|nr:TonB-dependent receptor [Steroidobacteraceae bacterium]
MEKTDEVLRRRMRAMWVTGISTLTLGTTCIPNAAFAANDDSNSGSDDSATTGILASLLSSTAAKKDSAGLVDVISAEDIGRFPDSNLATAMARLPGVAASHESSIGFTSTGDTTSITVRGFGPSFNTTLVDGRQLASATGTRAFDFSTIGTESVKAVHVLKTPDATLSIGAIGATIDIINRLPFDKPGLQLNGLVSGTDASGEGKITPNGALLFSNTYAGNTFGVLADIAYAQTKTKGNHTNIEGWTGTHLNCSQFATTPASCTGFYDTAPSWYEQDYNTYEEHNDDKRTSGRLALQWRPVANLLFTVNDDYSKDTLSQQLYGYSSGFSGPDLTNVVRNSNGTVVSFTYPASSIYPSSSPTLVNTHNIRAMENNDVGVNVKWDATDHQTYLVDYSSSVSELRPTYTAPVTQVGSVLNKNTVDDFKLQGTWKGDELKIDYGAQYSTNSEHLNNLNYYFNQQSSYVPSALVITLIPFQVIDEHTGSFFLNGLWKVSLGSTRLSVNAGLREEQTRVTSEAFNQQLPTALTVEAVDHTVYLVSYTASMTISQDNRYNYLLPNLDLNFDITDTVKLRADVSRTLTRPPLSSINPDINVSPNQRVGALFANGGNPGLLPYLSYNRDLGVEWYYTKDSYLALDAFMKNISNAILYGNVLGSINNVVYPTTNQPAQFKISTQVNGASFRVNGIELSLQHIFGDSGFGFEANATFVNSDHKYNRFNITSYEFAVTGLTNSWNVSGFYDKNGLQFRIAVNHQNDALTSLGQEVNGSAFGLEPTYTNAATQVDARISYELNQHLSVYLDGQNLNNARYRTHGRFPEQLLNSVETGRRITAGIYLKL